MGSLRISVFALPSLVPCCQESEYVEQEIKRQNFLVQQMSSKHMLMSDAACLHHLFSI